MSGLILTATDWSSNAELIADVHRLGWLRDNDRVLDPTYGKGNWWTVWRPAELVCHDLKLDGVDFRCLPHPAGGFDAVAFDPAYVVPGGRKTSTIKSMHGAYGMDTAAKTPAAQQARNDAGLAECVRVTKPGGIIVTKSQHYVWGGELRLGTVDTINTARELGCKLVDEFVHLGRPGPQPKGRTRKDGSLSVQQHTRRNCSTLLVFRTPRRRREGLAVGLSPGRVWAGRELVGVETGGLL